jgi:hypothetical protein
MTVNLTKLLAASLTLLPVLGCMDADLGEHAAATTSAAGVTPTPFPGNFVASDDDQVCYELAQLGGWDVTSEMRGFKIDPPTSHADAAGTYTISHKGLQLAWSTNPGYSLLAVIVKGGPNFNLYDYQGSGLDADSGLTSPLHKNKIPAISHYNVCWQPDAPPAGDQGCTPGYWRNHADRWDGAASSDGFDATFGVTSGLGATYSLGQAIWAQGGGTNALARHATAALLNSYGGVPNGDGTTVAYPYSTTQVLEMVQAAFADGTIEATKDLFEAANELGCPLSGTPASPAS